MRWLRWLVGRTSEDTSAEARRCLDDLEARDDQVTALGAALTERARVNHFSELVQVAISRAAGDPR